MPSQYKLYFLQQSTNPVSLTVTIGNACKGSSTVKLDEIELNGPYHDSFSIVLGPNDLLINKTLEVDSLITKLIKGNNKSSVNITLEGGVETKEYPLSENSTANPVPYASTIKLVI
jgi:hypothetical protein